MLQALLTTQAVAGTRAYACGCKEALLAEKLIDYGLCDFDIVPDNDDDKH